MHGKAPVIIIAISLIAAVPYGASATPLAGGAGLTDAAEGLSQVENVHYYGYYDRGYYGRGYYGRGYGYGRGATVVVITATAAAITAVTGEAITAIAITERTATLRLSLVARAAAQTCLPEEKRVLVSAITRYTGSGFLRRFGTLGMRRTFRVSSA
jgi:hypothetical protein